MTVKIKYKKEVAKGTLRIEFDLLGQKVNFKSGQYFFLTISNLPFKDERGNRRHFTIVNSPNEKDIIAMTTRIRDTGFKKSLQELSVGTEVEINSIGGDFILPQTRSRPLVFIAGGIGITPFMSMLSYIDEEKLDFDITLIISNRDQESSVYLKDLEKIAKKNKNLKLIPTMTQDEDWKGEKRRIDEQFLKDYFKEPKNYFYYVSGPPNFVDGVVQSLDKAGVSIFDIKTENFSGY